MFRSSCWTPPDRGRGREIISCRRISTQMGSRMSSIAPAGESCCLAARVASRWAPATVSIFFRAESGRPSVISIPMETRTSSSLPAALAGYSRMMDVDVFTMSRHAWRTCCRRRKAGRRGTPGLRVVVTAAADRQVEEDGALTVEPVGEPGRVGLGAPPISGGVHVPPEERRVPEDPVSLGGERGGDCP